MTLAPYGEQMDVAKPPIVTATAWQDALASLTRQEEAVAAELD